MRIAYFDCFAGVAGDMTLGALVGCGLEPDALRDELCGLALTGYEIEHRKVRRGALVAHKIDVAIRGDEHPHRGLRELREILEASNLSAGVAEDAESVFEALCEAEAEVHGVSVDEVHLHEVGAIDAVVDIVGACAGLRRLGIESIHCSPLNLGGGQVEAAHGVLPVPAPATAYLLRDRPVYSAGPAVELVTPTGAALVSTLAEHFGGWPEVSLRAVGYGAGDHEFDAFPNVLRMAIGESSEGSPADASDESGREIRGATDDSLEGVGVLGHDSAVSVIETNIDDMSPQLAGHVVAKLLEAGALDAHTSPVFMKKNRPGFQITVLASRRQVDLMADVLFRETTTLGVRAYPVERRELPRHHVEVDTPWGRVRVKVAKLGDSVVSATPEYDDCERLAGDKGVPLKQVIAAAADAYRSHQNED